MFTLMSSPIFSNAVENSIFQVISEGSLKAVARPAITRLDKNGTPETRKYSATKELIFQCLSIAFYCALVIPIVKKGGYQLLKKMLQDKPKFEMFKKYKDVKGFMDARDAAEAAVAEMKPGAVAEAEKFIHPKGAIELTNMIGSGVILTILAPQVVTKIMHPIMGAIDKHNAKNKTAQQNEQGDTFVKTEQKESPAA